jgi:hypothetical protein
MKRNLSARRAKWKPSQQYRVLHKSVKQLRNSQQINYTTCHDNPYTNREKNSSNVFFFKETPRAELPWFAARKQQSPLLWLWSTVIC